MDLAGEDFAKAVDEALQDIRDMEDAQRIIREVAEEKLPRPEQQRTAWQRENAEQLQELSRERQAAWTDLRQQRAAETRKTYREVCKRNRRLVRRMVRRWWDERLAEMEAKIADLTATIEELTKAIAALQAEIAEM